MIETRFTLHDLRQAITGQCRLIGALRDVAQSPIRRVVIDSREVQAGDVFWALRGRHVDGSRFVDDAFRRGASGVVCRNSSVRPPIGCWALVVEDPLAALWSAAAWRRECFSGQLVAVTGSVGKTTARNMIHTVLGSQHEGVASPRNYNNHIGVPLGMLALNAKLDYAVFELGASALGEIAQLAELCRPRVGVITRLGDAHLGRFGGYRNIVLSKMELIAALPDDGLAVLNGDDARLRRHAARLRVAAVWTGRDAENDLVATHVRSRNGMLSFRVDGQSFRVPVWGRHYLHCALAAVAVGRWFGMRDAAIAEALANYEQPALRCQVVRVGGVSVINDAYNASPVAMRAALELLRDFETNGRRVVVCGDMLELGELSESLHCRLGEETVTLCVADALVVCGEKAQHVVQGAVKAGMPEERAVAFRWPEQAVPWLIDYLRPGDVVLVKGSRAMEMERIVHRLIGEQRSSGRVAKQTGRRLRTPAAVSSN